MHTSNTHPVKTRDNKQHKRQISNKTYIHVNKPQEKQRCGMSINVTSRLYHQFILTPVK